MNENDWFRLTRANDWGVDYYSRVPLRYGMASQKRAYKLVEGLPVVVRLTNGSELTGVIRIRYRSQTVGDHGHNSSVTSKVPIVDFGDGTTAEVDAVDLQYHRALDPTADE